MRERERERITPLARMTKFNI